MIKINLLSPLDKENLKWEKLNNLALKGIVHIVIVEALFVAGFLFTVEYLKAEQKIVGSQLADAQSRSDTKEVNDMEADLKDFKGKIDSIYSVQKNRLQWTLLLENIADAVPDGAKLASVSISEVSDKKDAKKTAAGSSSGSASKTAAEPAGKFKVEIAGKADARENLLTLENNLKKSQFFTDLEYDDANYVESADIDFHYAFYVSRDKLTK